MDREQRRAERRSRRPDDPTSVFGGTLIALFVTGLIFGNALVGFTLLGLAALIAAAYFLLPQAQQGFSILTTVSSFKRAVALVIPVFVLAGIFGNPMLMIVVLILAALALTAATFSVRSVLANFPEMKAEQGMESLSALPAQPSGNTLSETDIRALCRGLPPAVAGQIFATVEHLETVAAEAKRSGDTRRSYDAQQGLKDYLPTTIDAWKAQAEDQRDLGELTRALEQVYEIAGTQDSGGEAGRRAWETQQRFLDSRRGRKD